MDLFGILEQGKSHVVFNDGYEADFRKGGSGNLIFYNQALNGEPIDKGNMVVKPEYAERFTQDHQGIKGTTNGEWELREEPEADEFEDMLEEDLGEPEGPAEALPEPEEGEEPEDVTEAEFVQPEPEPAPKPEAKSPEPEAPMSPIRVEKIGDSYDAPVETDVIGAGTVIKGDVVTESNIEIKGRIAGSVQSKGSVSTVDGSSIEGNVKAVTGLDVRGAVHGDLSSEEGARVEGFVDGSIMAGGNVELAGAKVKGDISGGDVALDQATVVIGNVKCGSIRIDGSIEGNIDSAGTVSLGSDAAVIGDIKAGNIAMENGALFKGRIEQAGGADVGDRFASLRNLRQSDGKKEKNERVPA